MFIFPPILQKFKLSLKNIIICQLLRYFIQIFIRNTCGKYFFKRLPCNYQKNFHWNEYVLSQCEKQFRKPLKRLLELIQWDLFSEVDTSIDFIFKIQSSNDESKEIANNKLKADTYVTLTDAGIISPEEARKALAEDEKSGFNSIDVDNVPEPVMADNEDLLGNIGFD